MFTQTVTQVLVLIKNYVMKTIEGLTVYDAIDVMIMIADKISNKRQELKLTRNTEIQEMYVKDLTHLRNLKRAFSPSYQMKAIWRQHRNKKLREEERED